MRKVRQARVFVPAEEQELLGMIHQLVPFPRGDELVVHLFFVFIQQRIDL